MRDTTDAVVKFEYLVYIFKDGKMIDCCIANHAVLWRTIPPQKWSKFKTIKTFRNIFKGKTIRFRYCPFDYYNVEHEQDLVMKKADEPWERDYLCTG
eukprot:305021_1